MASRHVLELVSLIIGYVFTGGLYLSPIPTIRQIWTAGDVAEYKVDMFHATLASCLVWLLYGLPPDMSKAIVNINAVGILIEAVYLGIFFCFSTPQNRHQLSMVTVFVVAGVGFIASLVFPLAKDHRRVPLGYIGAVTSVAMYAGPLRQMIAAWKAKDVQHMSVWVAGASLFSGISWTIYACLIGDNFILVPNAIGTLCGVAQLIFYMVVRHCYQPVGQAAGGGAAA